MKPLKLTVVPVSPYVSVGKRIVPAASIRYIDCQELVAKGKIRVLVDGRCIDLEGAEAIDLLMRTHPNFFEGKRMRWIKHSWAVHNLLGHPLMQILTWLGRPDLGMRVHDATIPRPEGIRSHQE